MSMDTEKYLFENGIMVLNPIFVENVGKPQVEHLAVLSTLEDILIAQAAQRQYTGDDGRLSDSMVASLEIMQDTEYLNLFRSPVPLEGCELVEHLSTYFEKYHAPIGLLNKLLALQCYSLLFIVDDSISMSGLSDVQVKGGNPVDKVTRWQEAQIRLHFFIDIIAYIPTHGITITFLNSRRIIKLDQIGKSPAEFQTYAHELVHRVFTSEVLPGGCADIVNPSGHNDSPLCAALADAFTEAQLDREHGTLIYCFTNGHCTDCSYEDLASFIITRQHPEHCPLTFLTCTDNIAEAQWMKDVRLIVSYCCNCQFFKNNSINVFSCR
jgi:hypothetical protein